MSTAHSTESNLDFFEVEVSYRGEGARSHPIDTWRGLARDQAHAESQAYDEVFDERLRAASCSPVYSTVQMDRYLVSEGWGHIFVGNTESTTRWVLDRSTEKLAYADVAGTGLKSSTWFPMSSVDKNDLLQSLLHANDILRDFGDFGVEESDVMPTWAAEGLEDEADAAVAGQRLAEIKSGSVKLVDGAALDAGTKPRRRAKP